jgi:predicted  nucleic acid-binding Zn-ribbon protein
MIFFSGDKPGIGAYQCECGMVFEITTEDEALPLCPRCGHGEFEKLIEKPQE